MCPELIDGSDGTFDRRRPIDVFFDEDRRERAETLNTLNRDSKGEHNDGSGGAE